MYMVYFLWYDRYDRTIHRTVFYFHRTKRPSYHPLQAIITLDGERISAQNRGSFESSRRALSNGKNRGYWLVDARKLWAVFGDSIVHRKNSHPGKYRSYRKIIHPGKGIIVPPIVPYKRIPLKYRTKLRRTMNKRKKQHGLLLVSSLRLVRPLVFALSVLK